MTQSIIDKMMQEAETGEGWLAARKVTDGEWITVRDNHDRTYTWWHDWWDADKPHQWGDPGFNRSEILEDQAAVFLADIKE